MNSSNQATCDFSKQLQCGATTAPYYYCLEFDAFECSRVEACGCPPLNAEPDIAGIGMIIAFTVTVALTWLSTLGQLILMPPAKQRHTNVIDEFCDRHIGRRVRNLVPLHALFSDCLYQVTVALSDQQLVTGIAILVAGLKMHAQDSISVYHFSVVRELAFFSSNSHLLSLLALWNSFSSERKRFKVTGAERRFPISLVTKWRFSCMFIFFILLLVTTWKTAYRQWDDLYACPAHCVPQGISQLGGPPLGWAIATTYFLITSYFLYAVQLGEKILGRHTRLRAWTTKRSNTLQDRLASYPNSLRISRIMGHLALAWRFWVFSGATELVVMLGWSYANFVWTLQDRADGRRLMKEYSNEEWTKENQMGFGQIVPLLLLMLPFMTFAAAYNENMENLKAETEENAPSI